MNMIILYTLWHRVVWETYEDGTKYQVGSETPVPEDAGRKVSEKITYEQGKTITEQDEVQKLSFESHGHIVYTFQEAWYPEA